MSDSYNLSRRRLRCIEHTSVLCMFNMHNKSFLKYLIKQMNIKFSPRTHKHIVTTGTYTPGSVQP